MNNFTTRRSLNKNTIFDKVTGKEVFVGIVKTKYPHMLEGVDILGEGGYALIPPSKINGNQYKPYNNKEILKINKDDYKKIKNFFLLQKTREMRSPFVDLINGLIEIESYSSRVGKKEFLYWKFLFRELWNFCGLIPREIYHLLEKNQPSFNKRKTEIQLQHHPYTEPPISNDRLKEMFPEHNDIRSNGRNTNLVSIENKLDKLIEMVSKLYDKTM